MRNYFISLTFLIFFTTIHSQNPPEINIDSMLIDIDKSSFTSGILYDRTVSWANIASFNQDKNVSNKGHFEQALLELHKASNQQKFIPHTQLRTYYTHDSIQNVVDIGILNATFHQLNFNQDNENAGALRVVNEKFEKINNNKESFIEIHTLVIAPLKEYLVGENITFLFNSNFLLEDAPSKNIMSLTANFETQEDFVIIENGAFLNNSIQINYTTEGYKILSFTVDFDDGSTITTQATVHVGLTAPPSGPMIEDGTTDATIPFQGYDESVAINGHLEFRIFYGNPQAKLLKPVIIIDGFDPGDKRKIQDSDSSLPSEEHISIEEMMIYFESGNPTPVQIIPLLRSLGYDVVIVNHPTYFRGSTEIDGGADFIERNALTHVQLYQQLNTLLNQNNSTEELIIVGPSMGGLISRYALSYMETNNIDHNTRLWVSIDSPHLGANIPIGLQSLINQAAPNNVAAQDFVDNQLGSTAAKQQLIEQFNGWNGNQLKQDFFDARTVSQGYAENRGHPFYTNFYTNLFNNGLANSNGFPQNSRKIVMINGSLKGNNIFYNPFTQQQDNYNGAGQIGVNIRGFQTVCFPFPICWDLHIASLEGFTMPNFNTNSKVSRFKKLFNDDSKYATNINSRGNMDNISGGWYPGYEQVAGPIDGADPVVPSGGFWSSWDGVFSTVFSILSDILGGADLTVYSNEYSHSFIPTISSLGFRSPDFNWNQNLNRNLVCTGEIPFDTYFGPSNNERHTSFTQESVTWLLQELGGNHQPPIVYLESDDIQGPNAICQNIPVTYDFDTCVAPPVQSWEVSGNIQILTSDDSSVTVETTTSSSGNGFIRAIFPNQTVQKDIWVGTPMSPGSLSGPEIVTSGSLAYYSGGFSQGATGYQWWLPHPYDVASPIDYFNDNWQVLPNAGNATNIFTGYAGNNGLVQLMGVNECGPGDAAMLYVEHGSGGGGTIPLVPYPNTSDTSFNLDFSTYPSGNYYIYIYDAYSNIMYQGESTNIEKTIETVNIPNGLYYLHIHDGNEVTAIQLVIEH